MFKVQFQNSSGGWNLAALPTSYQVAVGQARVVGGQDRVTNVRLAPSVTKLPSSSDVPLEIGQVVDLKV